MSSTITRSLTSLAAGALISAGLVVGGSLGMAHTAVADTRTSVADSESHRPAAKPARKAPAGLNGTLPQRPGTDRLPQFSHLPFDPAMPGGD